MKKLACTIVLIFLTRMGVNAQLPQKYDSLYKTIFAKDFCKMMQQDPGIVLIDVRSPGEYSDTSYHASLNMGHLKGAVNISIDTIKKNVAIMDKYKDKTLVLYCSHSQRSRRVGKLLSENGFKNCYNLNGGMSSLNQLNEKDFPCRQSWIQYNVAYKNLSNNEAVDFINKEKNLVVVDVRPTPQFENNDTLEENNIGHIKGAVNIPYSDFKQRTNELKNYMNKPVLLYTASGDGDAARAAGDLTAAGFTKIYLLPDGIQGFIADEPNFTGMEHAPDYHILNAENALGLLKTAKALTIYDTRPKPKFENTDSTTWRNIGRIKNAIHVEETGFEHLQLPPDKNAAFLIYGHGEAWKLGKMLASKGYKNVNVTNGLWDFVWSSFNIESCKEAKVYIVNHEGLF